MAFFNEYDSVVIVSLAMTACVTLLKSGKQIDFQGAGGDGNFNGSHNVFSGFSIVG